MSQASVTPAARYVVRNVVRRLHLACTRRQVIAAVWRALSREGRRPEHREFRRALYAIALEEQAANRALYRATLRSR